MAIIAYNNFTEFIIVSFPFIEMMFRLNTSFFILCSMNDIYCIQKNHYSYHILGRELL